jgi:arginine N-succinyltransferase
MPKFPIYLDLLPAEAQACIGRPHDTSAIAMKMLLDEGFRFENYVDVFDAGPQVFAPLSEIKTVVESNVFICATNHGKENENEDWLITNGHLERFRVVCALASVQNDTITLNPAIRKALDCDLGSNVRAVLNAA